MYKLDLYYELRSMTNKSPFPSNDGVACRLTNQYFCCCQNHILTRLSWEWEAYQYILRGTDWSVYFVRNRLVSVCTWSQLCGTLERL